jgi:hypothetical protein
MTSRFSNNGKKDGVASQLKTKLGIPLSFSQNFKILRFQGRTASKNRGLELLTIALGSSSQNERLSYRVLRLE